MLASWRHDRSVTVRRMADILSGFGVRVSPQAINRWELGYDVPAPGKRDAIERATGIARATWGE